MSAKIRTFSKFANSTTKTLLEQLAKTKIVPKYRQSMFLMGLELGNKILAANPKCEYFYLVCTVEDADFLAKGIMECFNINNKKFNFACFWNSRERAGEMGRISPVIKRYVEPYSPAKGKKGQMVIVKSLISGACVVKTNIKEVINKINPEKIFVAAPVMYKDAAKKLEQEFEKDIIKKFEYIYIAKDYKKTDKGFVEPGVGDVYKRLGFKDQATKNKYIPIVVKERRASYLLP